METLLEKRINANGQEKSKFLPFGDSVKVSQRLLPKSIGASFLIDYSMDPGFKDLCATSKVRDRLMHPKHLSDIQVSENDIKAVGRGVTWFNVSFQKIMDLCQEHSQNSIERMMREIGMVP